MRNTSQIEQYINGGHKGVEGWFYEIDMLLFYYLSVFQEERDISGSLCEVGVYIGKSLILLGLLKADKEKLFGVDIFLDESEEQTKLNLGKYGLDKICTLLKTDTSLCDSAWLEVNLDAPVRFLHIDAGHEYVEVYRDLLLFSDVVSDAGIIALDDYQDPEFPGIEAAMYKYCYEGGMFTPFAMGQNKIYLCATHMASIYQKYLLSIPAFSEKARVTRLLGRPVLITNSRSPVDVEFMRREIELGGIPERDDYLTADLDELKEKVRRFGTINYFVDKIK